MDINQDADVDANSQKVSIPERDFSGYQLSNLLYFVAGSMFQSLKGILVDINLVQRFPLLDPIPPRFNP